MMVTRLAGFAQSFQLQQAAISNVRFGNQVQETFGIEALPERMKALPFREKIVAIPGQGDEWNELQFVQQKPNDIVAPINSEL